MCKVISCVVGRECLLWTVCSLDKTLLAFALLHFVLQRETCLLLQVSSTSYFCILIPYDEKNIFIWGGGRGVQQLALKDLVGLHRTIQLQFLQHYWLRHRLGLLWYWNVYLGNKLRLFCCFWDCIQVLHFRLFCWLWGLLHFFLGFLAHSSRYNGHLNYIHPLLHILVQWFLKCRCLLLPLPVWPFPIYLDSWT